MNYSTYSISRRGFFKKKYSVFKDGQQVFYATSSAFIKHGTIWDYEGRVLFEIKRPFAFMKLKMEIYEEGALVASMVKKQKLFMHNLIIDTAEGEYVVEGKAFLKEFTMFFQGFEIAKISRKPFSPKKLYGIAIEGNQDEEMIIAIILCVEMILRIQKQRNAG